MLSISKGTRFTRASLQLWYGNANVNWAAFGYKKKEKKHDYTYHLVTSLNFISSRNICSALPSIDWRKNGGRFLVKAQFKKKPKFWREAQGKENNTKSQILDFNSWHFFGTNNVCEFFPKLNIRLFVWIFISCLMLFKEYWQTYFPLV